jgi:hypothetical protein
VSKSFSLDTSSPQSRIWPLVVVAITGAVAVDTPVVAANVLIPASPSAAVTDLSDTNYTLNLPIHFVLLLPAMSYRLGVTRGL